MNDQQEREAFDAWFKRFWAGDPEDPQPVPSTGDWTMYAQYQQARYTACSAWKARAALPSEPDAEQVRRLAEDWADDCVKAGYVTTLNCSSWHRMVAAINALPPATAGEPFLYAIRGPDGRAHMDEQCVSTSKHDLADTVFYLNDEKEAGPYAEVPLYTAPQPAATSTDALLREVGRAMVDMTTTVRGEDEWMAIPALWQQCMDERDQLQQKLAATSDDAQKQTARIAELERYSKHLEETLAGAKHVIAELEQERSQAAALARLSEIDAEIEEAQK